MENYENNYIPEETNEETSVLTLVEDNYVPDEESEHNGIVGVAVGLLAAAAATAGVLYATKDKRAAKKAERAKAKRAKMAGILAASGEYDVYAKDEVIDYSAMSDEEE